MCYNEDFVVSRFVISRLLHTIYNTSFIIQFTVTLGELKNIVRYTEDSLNRSSTVSYCFFPEDLFFAFLLLDLFASRHSLITGSSI